MEKKDLLSRAKTLRDQSKKKEYQSWWELFSTTQECSEIIKKLLRSLANVGWSR